MNRRNMYLTCACATLLLAGAGLGARTLLERRGKLSDHEGLFRHGDPETEPGVVYASYLGTTSLLLSDGHSHVMIDGFFTRPSNKLQLFFGKLKSDRALIRQSLDRLGIQKLDAVLVFHSHYDHVMDSPEVARQTGALLVGSPSTAMVGRGDGLPESQIHVVKPGEVMKFGDFTIHFILSKHIRLPWILEKRGLTGTIEHPVTQPASLFDYKEGGTYAILVEHPRGSCMLHSGAVNDHELDGYQADTVFICTPGLDQMKPKARQHLFKEVLEKPKAQRIVPVHWDDFTQPLNRPLQPLASLASDFDTCVNLLQEQATQMDADFEFFPAWEAVRLF